MVTKRIEKQAQIAEIFNEACAAGLEAGKAYKPKPIYYYNSPVAQRWLIPKGLCGFAWVNIRPGTSSAARYAKKHLNAHKDYYGGVSIPAPAELGQAIERKEAWGRAFAETLRRHNIKAEMRSRLD